MKIYFIMIVVTKMICYQYYQSIIITNTNNAHFTLHYTHTHR